MEQDVMEIEVLDEGCADSEELAPCCKGASAQK